MALSNAERQRNYRKRRNVELVNAKTLRDDHARLVAELEKLRNENNALKQEITTLNKRITGMELDSNNTTDATTVAYDERLAVLRIPLQYHKVYAASQPDAEFTRMTPQLWVRSKGVPNYKFAYRLVLLQTGNRYLLELRPPLDKKSEEKLQSFITWREMEDYIKERGL